MLVTNLPFLEITSLPISTSLSLLRRYEALNEWTKYGRKICTLLETGRPCLYDKECLIKLQSEKIVMSSSRLSFKFLASKGIGTIT